MNWNIYNRYEFVIVSVLLVIMNTFAAWVDAESLLMEYREFGYPLEAWKSYLWAFSSHYALIGLVPLVLVFDHKFPLLGQNWLQGLIAHGLFSVVFCLLHLIIMVSIRKAVHSSLEDPYEFGDFPAVFIYEYRKDLEAYVTLVFYIYVYRFVIVRLRGEAKVVNVGEDHSQSEPVERFLVKKLGKEFIIRIKEIEWIEASGNYMNLHIGGRVYPYRETMTVLERKLKRIDFVRIHRSILVNLRHVEEIHSSKNGDFRVKLASGKTLNLSRRYRSRLDDFMAFKQ